MTADVTGSPDPISDEARQAAAKALLDEGGGPGNGLHSWRCEYPDRYGPCDCVQEVADLILAAAAPLLVSADSSAQAERLRRERDRWEDEAKGWERHLIAAEVVVEGLRAELAKLEAAITKLRATHADALADRDAITRVIMRERDELRTVVDGLRAELARTDDAISEAFDALRGMAQDIDISPVVRALEMPGSAARVAALQAATSGQALNVVFDGPPGPVSGRFIEVETDDGASVNAGEWSERPNGWWVLRIPAALRAAGGQEKPTDARVGFSVWLDREQWGLVSDGLVSQRQLLLERKRINSESTADLSADAVADVLRLLSAADPITGSAAPVGGQAEPSDNGTYLAECQTCQTLREPDPGHPIPRGAASRAMRCDTCEEIRWHRRANGAPAAAVSGEQA